MKINKLFIISAVVLMIPVSVNLLNANADIRGYAGESIPYLISPLGIAEYNNLGMVDLEGAKVNLVTLGIKVFSLFENTEKIYYDPESLLPCRIERTVSTLLGKKFITEDYDQKKFTVVVKRFKGKKLIKEQVIKAKGPIQNVILFLFYLRNHPDFKIGWNFTAEVPAEVKLELVTLKLELISIDEVKVPAGKFQAYHFKSIPNAFEIWINKDTPRVPLKIKSNGIMSYSVVMKNYSATSV